MKKYICIILAVVLLISVISVTATTEEKNGISGSQAYYYAVNKTYPEQIITFEAEIRLPKGYTENAGYIMGTHGYAEEFYNFRINTNGMPHMYIRNSAYVHDEYKFNKVNIATGEWVHLAIVRDTQNGVMKCYVDGKYVQSIELSDKTFVKSSTPFAIGGDFTELNNNFFRGEIHSIKLYSDVRTASEIKSDMFRNDTDNQIAYYDFNEVESTIYDKSGNEYNAEYKAVWIDEEPVVDDFDYSMVVVGDQQYLNRLYGESGDMDTMYDYIVDFASDSDNKVEYLFNMGDITDQSTQAEWDRAVKGFDMLTEIGVDYSFVRGNHDLLAGYNANLAYDKYGRDIVDGTYCGDMTSYYKTLEIGGVNYLMLVLDYAPKDEVLEWANTIVKKHPLHNVIVATHGYATPADYDNLILWENTEDLDTNHPFYVYNDGVDIWEKFISKHDNISLVLCGHTLTKNVVTRTDVGDNGNVVTTMLVNPQETDNVMKKAGYEHGSGLVTHLYFSNGGKDVQIRYYSTVLNKWFRSDSQYSISLDVIGDDNLTGADFN